MKPWTPVLLLAVAAVFCRGAVAADSANDAKLKAVLQGRYAEMKTAMAARDAKAIAKVLAPDCVSEDVLGNIKTATQMIDEVVQLPENDNKSETTLLSVVGEGDRATVTQRYRMTSLKLLPGSTTSHAVELVTTSTDTRVMIDGAWRLQRTVTESLDYTIDGNRIVHKERDPGTKRGT
jgi:ketosteroid isomerase-like protein